MFTYILKSVEYSIACWLLCFVIISEGVGEFSIYHSRENEDTGFCLVAVREGNKHKVELKSSCSVDNEAWQWQRLKPNLLRNVKYQRCIGAVLDSHESVKRNLELLPCDPYDLYQQWSCDYAYGLMLEIHEAKKLYLASEVRLESWKVVGGRPVLSNVASRAEWIVYSGQENKVSSPVCKIPSIATTSDIITVEGGPVVGKKCVFPYTRNEHESWGCFAFPNGTIACPTTYNYDLNPTQWGVCSSSIRGVMSEWVGPSLCDKPCGGGRVHKRRHCLYAPCTGVTEGPQKGLQCNTQPCTGDVILSIEGNSHQFQAEGYMPILGDKSIGKCYFPFVADGEVHERCISDHRRNRRWCSLTNDFDKHKKWGYCLEEFRGKWGNWQEVGACSRTCGGGQMTLARACHFQPCWGTKRKAGRKCNTKACWECYYGSGEAYRGITNVANDGTVCQRWTVHEPHSHPETTLDQYPELEINYCRNPAGTFSQPFCYRNKDDLPPRMYCDIPVCSTGVTTGGIPYTVPVTLDKEARPDPCHFPFQYRSQWYDACVLLDEVAQGREKCKTTADQFAYCPRYFSGAWTNWEYAGDCDRSCGGGSKVYFRTCLFPPCEGSAIRVAKEERCNLHPCFDKQTQDCFVGSGLLYNGTVARTAAGMPCARWDSDVSNHHNSMLPLGLPRLRENHCRNPTPGVRRVPWCYVVQGTGADSTEYCDVSRCPRRVGEVWAIPNRAHQLRVEAKPCVFPYVGVDGHTHDACSPVDSKGSFMYCATQERQISSLTAIVQSLDQKFSSGEFAICPTGTRGAWSTWSGSGECTADCGGGKYVRSRKCLHPPCDESDAGLTDSQPDCNTKPCKTCLAGKGTTYRGNVSVAVGGACIPWKDFESHDTSFKPSVRAELQGNFCRNPMGRDQLPWCFVSSQLEKSYCEIRYCDDGNLHSVPYTIPESGRSTQAKSCHFPYRYQGEHYHNCHGSQGRSYCPHSQDEVQNRMVWGRCPSIYTGRWTVWKKTTTCSKMCGGGQEMYIRECLIPPCEGHKIKLEGHCNTNKCPFKKTMVENVNCFIGEGQAYHGETSKTLSNLNCMRWADFQDNHYPLEGGGVLLNHALCRNPSPFGFRLAPWCFVNDRRRWEYCDIPRCPAHKGEIRTVGGPDNDKSCAFPFTSNGQLHESCQVAQIQQVRVGDYKYTTRLKFCATVQDSDQSPQRRTNHKWGICPPSTVGTLSPLMVATNTSSSVTCTRSCGGGEVKWRRYCRMEPCDHNAMQEEVTNGKCNTQPCEECMRGDGVSYRGTKYKLPSGKPCLMWSSEEVSRILRVPSVISRIDALEDRHHNFCRNPMPHSSKLPVCIIESGGRIPSTIQVCDVPRCELKEPVLNVDGDPCVFPFRVNGKLVESCQPRPAPNRGHYCGRVQGRRDVIREDEAATCSPQQLGTWGSWAYTGQCSKPCGKGGVIYKRPCRYPPCVGDEEKLMHSCNIADCDKRKNCYDVLTRGREFVGNSDKYRESTPCRQWLVVINYRALVADHPEIDFHWKNCRNPGAMHPRPFCNTNPWGQVQVGYCDVPPCPGTAIGPIMVPTSTAQYRPPKSPCIFPFMYRGKTYHACTDDRPPIRTSRLQKRPKDPFWCGTTTNVNEYLNDEWGWCPGSSRGLWTQWDHDARQCTTACVWLVTRHCLHPPCKGKKWRLGPEPCSDSHCIAASWASWGSWTRCDECARTMIRHRFCFRDRNAVDRSLCVGSASEVKFCGEEEMPLRCDSIYASGYLSEREVHAYTSYYNSLQTSTAGLRLYRFECSNRLVFIWLIAWRVLT